MRDFLAMRTAALVPLLAATAAISVAISFLAFGRNAKAENWICTSNNNEMCFRTKPDCVGLLVADGHCVPSERAYCLPPNPTTKGMLCFRALEECRAFGENCVGVE